MLKLKCTSVPENSLLVVGKVYTTDHVSENGRVLVNVFEDMSDYAPMYGSFNASRFDLLEEISQ